MPRAPKQCGHPVCNTRVTGRTYCPAHDIKPLSPTGRARNQRAERNRRADTVAQWVAANGWTCPGWQRPSHPSRDLTAAHSTAVTHGGAGSHLTVLCRQCNSRQGTTAT